MPKNLIELSKNFEINNNATKLALNEVQFNKGWESNSVLITTSSTASIMTLVVIIIAIIFCIRKCKSKKDLIVKIESQQNKFGNSSNSLIENKSSDYAEKAKMRQMDFSCDTADLELDDKAKRISSQFKRL